MQDVVFTAHRGASGLGHSPENTLPAFIEAIEIGVDCVECDVHCTKDGQVVVIHDSTINRTTNKKGSVIDMTLEEIKEADAGQWFSNDFIGVRIPTLGELLEITKGKVIAVIEIKPDNITHHVVKEIEKANAVDEVILQSFHAKAVKSALELNPKIPRALLIGGSSPISQMKDIMPLIHTTLEVGATTLNVSGSIITPRLIKEVHKRALSIWAWTIDDEARITELIDIGIDGITSNYPEKLTSLNTK